MAKVQRLKIRNPVKFPDMVELNRNASSSIEHQEKQLEARHTKPPTQKKLTQIARNALNDFMRATERLRIKCLTKINAPEPAYVKEARRLLSAGFINSDKIKNGESYLKGMDVAKGIISSIEYYKLNYPEYTFITKRQVETICQKYNLAIGDVAGYYGNVPDDKIRDIEAFQLKRRDTIVELWTTYNFSERLTTGIMLDDLTALVNDDAFLRMERRVRQMQICALERKDYSFEHRVNYTPPPPCHTKVVLQPVYDGYLIITFWIGDVNMEPTIV